MRFSVRTRAVNYHLREHSANTYSTVPLYRCGDFKHEIRHREKAQWQGFRFEWNSCF